MIKFLFLALFAILMIAEASPKGRSLKKSDIPHYGSLDEEWAAFKKKFSRKYPNAAEEAKRKAIFAKTLEEVKAQNEQYERGQSTWIAGINHMCELPRYPLDSPSKLTSFFILSAASRLDRGGIQPDFRIRSKEKKAEYRTLPFRCS